MQTNVKYDLRETTFDMPKVQYAVCAVSGGMDSAVCLFHSVKVWGKDNVVAVSLYYGQKHDVELRAAEEECNQLGVRYITLDMSTIFSFNKDVSALLNGSSKEIVQDKDYATLMHEKIEKGEAPISDEYIPNRNSLFLNILCAIGLQTFNEQPFAIVTGIHSDDVLKQEGSNVGAYPDCSPEFALATNKALQLSTAGLCFVYTPLVFKTKTQVAEFGLQNGMSRHDFNRTWSCYKGGRKQCGKCPTCIDRIHALVNSGVYTAAGDILNNYAVDAVTVLKFMEK